MVVDDLYKTPEMSVGILQTENYIWNPSTDCLGEGTYGKVYRAISKQTGEKVAVKTFKFAHPQISQEMRMLQTLKHPYIIQFLGVETECQSRSHVIVTEFCSGGSLMQFLNEPENVNGLVDEEFLLVIEHLSGGLEYLKRHDVIHRDVKPDNIMRHVLDDGGIIYKLADFGTARELPEGQNFTSLYGTEPYLHPQLYKACFFREASYQREFSHDTDLWSVGVTLYHVATGALPFRVTDRSKMLSIYDEMQRNPGIISAVQEWDSDRVTFSKRLPENSRLSLGLRQLAKLIIAGLFIQDNFLKWTFTRYYEEVKKIMDTRAIQLFYLNKMQILKVYVNPDESFEDFRNHVREQVGISNENQVFFDRDKLILNLDDIPRRNCDCIFLLDRMGADVEPFFNIKLNYENLSNFRSKFMDANDIRQAFLARKDLCLCTQLMEHQSRICDFSISFMENSNSYCNEQLKEQRKISDYLLEKYATIKNTATILDKIHYMNHSKTTDFTTNFDSYTNAFVKESNKLMNTISETGSDINFDHKCHTSYLRTAEKELADMKTLCRKLMDGKLGRQEYECDKLKIVHCVGTILTILTDKMEPHFEVFVRNLNFWYKQVFTQRMLALGNLKRSLNRFRGALKKFESEIQDESEKNLQIMEEGRPVSSYGNVTLILQKYKEIRVDIDSIIEENSRVVEQLENLSWDPMEHCEEFKIFA